MTFVLDLRTRPHAVRGNQVLIDGFPFVCGWCNIRFLNARELVTHVCEARERAA